MGSSGKVAEVVAGLNRQGLSEAFQRVADMLSQSSTGSSSSSRGAGQQQWGSRRRRLLQPGGMKEDLDAAGDDNFEEGEDDLGRSAGAAAIDGQGAGSPSASLSPAAAAAGPSPHRKALRHVGVPVFFHRASITSKFFPDCVSADKIKTHYCEAEWVTVPLSSNQADHGLQV